MVVTARRETVVVGNDPAGFAVTVVTTNMVVVVELDTEVVVLCSGTVCVGEVVALFGPAAFCACNYGITTGAIGVTASMFDASL